MGSKNTAKPRKKTRLTKPEKRLRARQDDYDKNLSKTAGFTRPGSLKK